MEKPTITLHDGTVIQTPEYTCKEATNNSYVSFRWNSVGGFECIQDREYGAKNWNMTQLKFYKAEMEDKIRFHQNHLKEPHRAELLLIRYDQCLQHMARRVIGIRHEGTSRDNLKRSFQG